MDKIASIKRWLNGGGSRRKWTAALFAVSILITVFLFISTGSTPEYGALEPTPLYFFGIIAKLVAVLLLIVGGAIFLRRWQVKSGLGRYNGRLSIVETVRLSPKQAVHLVKVGNQHLLIGATDQTISMLAPIDLPSAEIQPETDPQRVEAKPEQGQPQLSFNQLLQTLTSNQPNPTRPNQQSKE